MCGYAYAAPVDDLDRLRRGRPGVCTFWLLLFQICLLAEELGNHEGRLGWGEGSFYEKGTRGRQTHTRHQ